MGALQVCQWLPSVRQTYVAPDRRLELIGDVVMKVVMLGSSSLFQNVLLEEQRSCQSAAELHDRQFNLKENGGLCSMSQRRTRKQPTSILFPHVALYVQHCDNNLCRYKRLLVFRNRKKTNLKELQMCFTSAGVAAQSFEPLAEVAANCY